jgi:multidrug efflux system membrane fusion protein
MIKFKQRATASAVAALIAAGGLTAFCVYAVAEDSPAPVTAPAAPQVDVAEVVARRIVDWQNYSGRLEAIDRVDIRPLVSGRIVQVHFEDGSLVKKGDPLFTIDPRPYAAEVARAQAQVAAAQARASWTGNDMARAERLLADNAVARRDYEEKQNASREAAANLQAAQAALEAARLNLEYTRITAPVAGRVSRAEVTLGNVVAAGAASQPLTTLMSVSKLYASFDVDEQSFLKYINPSRSTSKSVIPVHLGLANESGYSREGRVASVDNRLDTSSGTIRVRAVFDNADGSLLPGLYARIQLGGSTPRDGLLIDEKAIGTDQDKRFVLVVDDKNRTAYREIKVGANQSGLRIVESGLKAGDRIVVNGLQRVRPGDAITPRVVPMAGNPSAPVAGDVARKRV